MDIKINLLNTYFHELNPESIFNDISNPISKFEFEYAQDDEASFVLNQKLQFYSMDEISNIQEIAKIEKAFELLEEFVNLMLTMDGKAIKVKYDKMLAWRTASFLLDQDLFICNYISSTDLNTRTMRNDFNWDIIIKSNNIQLHKMLVGNCETRN